MIPIIAIRPEPGLSATVAAGAQLGLEISRFPLSEIRPCDWELPDLTGIDGLLVGSANALRHGGEQLSTLNHLPVLAVGETTAQQARQLGFDVEHIGEGGLQHLIDGLGSAPRHLLRLAGAARVPLDLPGHICLTDRVIYHVEDVKISMERQRILRDDCIVLLHSAGATVHFARECDRLGLRRSNIALATLGPRILEAAGDGWREARAAPIPTDIALLAMVRDMCH